MKFTKMTSALVQPYLPVWQSLPQRQRKQLLFKVMQALTVVRHYRKTPRQPRGFPLVNCRQPVTPVICDCKWFLRFWTLVTTNSSSQITRFSLLTDKTQGGLTILAIQVIRVVIQT